MRIREFRNSQTTGQLTSDWIPSNNIGTFRGIDLYTATTSCSRMADVVTEGFRLKRNQGVIINNPMFKEEIISRVDPTIWIHDGHLGSTSIHHVYYNHVNLSIANGAPVLPNISAFENLMEDSRTAIDLAVTRSWANVDVSDMQILASLGELPETVSWLKSILSRGVLANTKLKKKVERFSIGLTLARKAASALPKDVRKLENWKRVLLKKDASKSQVDLIGSVANAWLEYRYAIRPLVFEMKQCIEAMQSVIKKGTRQTARGKEIRLVDGSFDTTLIRSWPSQVETTVVRTSEKSSTYCRAGVLFEIEESLNTLLAIWGVDQPLESAWELVPFSFIYDWFFSIGDVISSWSISTGLKALASWVTVIYDSFVSKKCTSCMIRNAGSYVWDPPQVTLGQSYVSIRRKWRVPSPVRPILPSFDLKLNLAKCIDLGTIGRSLLGGGSVPSYVKRS